MGTVGVGPSPSEFYSAFLKVVQPQELMLAEAWEKPRQYTALMFSLFPPIAEALGFCCYLGNYFYLDTIFYKEKDITNFPSHWTYASFISVAVEHENECAGTAQEMNKLQLFNAPLKVLITYPYKRNSDSLLGRYAEIISAADVFDDISTLRRQLVIFGWKEGQNVGWKGFEYAQGSFRETDAPKLQLTVPGLH
jgi:hypothetical protein